MFFCHFLGAHGLYNGYNGAQCLRYGRHCQGHCKHQGIQDRHFSVQAQQEYQGAYNHDGHGKTAAELVQADLQRSLFLLGSVHQGCYLANLCIHTRGSHQDHCPSVSHQAAGIYHIGPVGQGAVAVQGSVALIHIGGLPSQGAFIDLKGIILQNPSVSHHQIACFQVQDVSGNHLGRRNLHLLSVP